MPPKKFDPLPVYPLKVTRRDSQPLSPSPAGVRRLHRILQVAMGWTNSHRHRFIRHERQYSIPRADDWQAVIAERTAAGPTNQSHVSSPSRKKRPAAIMG